MRQAALLFLLLYAGFAVAQGGGDAAKGKRMFLDSGEDLDYPSCAHCHATVSARDEAKETKHIRPAYPVFDSSHRGAWKNKKQGAVGSAADAGNFCVVAFQKRKKLPAGDLANLNAYLASVSPDKDVKPRKINYRPAIPKSLDGGDAKAGKGKVALYCGGCHGAGDEHIQFELKPKKKAKLKIAQKVRGYARKKGKITFAPNAGMMSFFAKDRLPDKDLLDILAYLGK